MHHLHNYLYNCIIQDRKAQIAVQEEQAGVDPQEI
jgi:hypothetical protein